MCTRTMTATLLSMVHDVGENRHTYGKASARDNDWYSQQWTHFNVLVVLNHVYEIDTSKISAPGNVSSFCAAKPNSRL